MYGLGMGLSVSQLLCMPLPTADPKAVNPASALATANALWSKVRPVNHKRGWQEAIRQDWVGLGGGGPSFPATLESSPGYIL